MTRGLALIPTDPTVTVLRVMRSAMPGEVIRHERGDEPRAVLVRPDIQNAPTPASRYVRVGVTAFAFRPDGNTDKGECFDLCTEAMTGLCRSLDPEIISASIESGPFEVTDDITKKPVYYGVVLLTVRAT